MRRSSATRSGNKKPELFPGLLSVEQLQDLDESVCPDARLSDPEIEHKYQWLSRICGVFHRLNSREEDPKESVREKTREIVEKHVDVTLAKKDSQEEALEYIIAHYAE